MQPIARLAEEMGQVGGDGGGIEAAAVLCPQGEITVHPAADGLFQHGAVGIHPALIATAGGRGVVAPVIIERFHPERIAGEEDPPLGWGINRQRKVAQQAFRQCLTPVAPGGQDQFGIGRGPAPWRGIPQAGDQVRTVVEPPPEGQHRPGVRADQRHSIDRWQASR